MGKMEEIASFSKEENEEIATNELALVGDEVVLNKTDAPKMLPQIRTMWNDVEVFKTTQRMADLLLTSDTIPQSYKGKLADCIVAIDMANRMGVSPLVIMQNSQIVRGNFSWKGTACKAMIDGCGKYSDSYYVEVGERDKDSWGYYLEAIDKRGRVIKGCTVDIKMAKAEGWYQKDGSKWKTMPELLLKYRAAAFFFRTECASLAMGFLTAEEQEDIAQPEKNTPTYPAAKAVPYSELTPQQPPQEPKKSQSRQIAALIKGTGVEPKHVAEIIEREYGKGVKADNLTEEQFEQLYEKIEHIIVQMGEDEQ